MIEENPWGVSLPANVTGVILSQEGEALVYDAEKLGPDVVTLSPDFCRIWTRIGSVFGSHQMRQVKDFEVLGMWDYEGKCESNRWSQSSMDHLIALRLASPSGKVIRSSGLWTAVTAPSSPERKGRGCKCGPHGEHLRIFA